MRAALDDAGLTHAALDEAACAGVPDADALLEKIRAYDPNVARARLCDAYTLAVQAHYGQRRKSGEPYIAHPVAVAHILAELHLDADTIITALLHDTVEDTPLTLDEVRARFGANVSDLVDGVTKLAQVSRARNSSSQAENLQKFVLAIASDVRVLLVKLADRLHNMRTLGGMPKPERREAVARETLEIYAPLARRIGVQRICGEMEDLAFQWVNPAAFESITRRLAEERATRAASVAEATAAITDELSQAGVEAMVYGREKRAYSIWRKLERRGIDFDDLADIYGFRVIVGSVDHCYRALGVIHSAYRCVPDRFKDFISTPKPNSYRSIHTTVIGPDNRRIELQIRTEAMERVAEDGVAAHWRYKNDTYGYDAEAAEAAGGDPLARLRPLVEILEHGGDPDEFLEHAKLEMFTDQVFAFTPRGKVIALPQGATPLDFAYAVHTELGDTCVGAKVNGRQRPLRTVIRNGDVVEIVRSGTPAPPPDWEEIAVTGRARSAIRRLIRRSRRGEMARLGRGVAAKAFLREGMRLDKADLSDALKRLEYASEDELFADIGQGRISGRNLFDAVFPGRARSAAEPSRDLIEDATAQLYVHGAGLTPGVSLHFCRACSPLPGDRIVAVLGDDAGATVHAIHCDLLSDDADAQDRWLDIGWTAEARDNAVSTSRVKATVQHAPGALAEIATAVAQSKGNITGLRILSRASDFFEMEFDVEVLDARHLSHIVAAMRACSSIVDAQRAQSQGDGE